MFQGTASRRRGNSPPFREGPTLDQHLVLRSLLESWPFHHPFSYSVLGPQAVQGMAIRADVIIKVAQLQPGALVYLPPAETGFRLCFKDGLLNTSLVSDA